LLGKALSILIVNTHSFIHEILKNIGPLDSDENLLDFSSSLSRILRQVLSINSGHLLLVDFGVALG